MGFMKGISKTGLSTGSPPSPISRLSDDALRMIFTCAIRGRYEWSGIAGAVTLSHVSRRWRALALDTASLWTQITSRCLKAIPLQLARSRGAPLFITWEMDHRTQKAEIKPLLCLLVENIGRLRSLDLFLGLEDLDEVLPHCFHDNPMLEELQLAFKPNFKLGNRENYKQHFYIQNDVPNFTPKLRFLQLNNVVISWPRSAIRLPSLTHLTIEHQSRLPGDERLTLSDLLQMLSNMPQLEALRLSQAVGNLESEEGLHFALLPVSSSASTPPSTASARRMIYLPTLRLLQVVVANPQSAVELSRHLSVHPQCVISYHCGLFDPDFNIPPALLIQNIFPPKSMRHAWRRFEFFATRTANNTHALTINTSLRTEDDDAEFLHGVPLPTLEVVGITDGDFDAVLRAAFQLFDVTRVRALQFYLRDDSPAIPSMWHEIFEPCLEIEDLELSTDGMKLFLLSLENNWTLFPMLQTLKQGWGRSLSKEEGERLATALRGRMGKGLQLDTISIIRSLEDINWTGCAKKLEVTMI